MDIFERPTQFSFSVFPPEHPAWKHYRLLVNWHPTRDRWYITDGNAAFCDWMAGDGTFSTPVTGDEQWWTEHLFELEVAKDLARHMAPLMESSGISAADWMHRTRQAEK